MLARGGHEATPAGKNEENAKVPEGVLGATILARTGHETSTAGEDEENAKESKEACR